MPYRENALWPESNPIFPTSLEWMFCYYTHSKDEEIAIYSGEVTCQRIHPCSIFLITMNSRSVRDEMGPSTDTCFKIKVHWCSKKKNQCQEKKHEVEWVAYLSALTGYTEGSTKSKGVAASAMVTDPHSMSGHDPRCCVNSEGRQSGRILASRWRT